MPVVVTVATLLAGTALCLTVDPLREAVGYAVTGDTGALRRHLLDLGVGGALVLVGLILVHAVVFYPGEIVNTAAGFVYGLAIGLPLVMAAWLVSGLAAYALGRVLGRPALHRILGEKRLADAEAMIERGGVPMLLAARLVPIVPFSIFGYVAGAARVPVGRYAWTSVVGFLPITVAFVAFGQRLQDFSLEDPVLWLTLLPILLLLALARPTLRRMRRDREEHSSEGG